MLIKSRGTEPLVNNSSFVAPTAVLVGGVSVGPRSRVMYGAVLDSEASRVEVGATVLQGATVGSGGVVAVGALVHANSVVPGEFFVPPNTIAVGDPVRIYAPGDGELPEAIRSANFARTAFGVQTAWEDRISRYTETAEVRSEEFGAHLEDVVLDTER